MCLSDFVFFSNKVLGPSLSRALQSGRACFPSIFLSWRGQIPKDVWHRSFDNDSPPARAALDHTVLNCWHPTLMCCWCFQSSGRHRVSASNKCCLDSLGGAGLLVLCCPDLCLIFLYMYVCSYCNDHPSKIKDTRPPATPHHQVHTSPTNVVSSQQFYYLSLQPCGS
jgi:hypothetical protein